MVPSDSHHRRTYLKTVGLLAATTTVSGCLGDDADDGGDDEFLDGDPPYELDTEIDLFTHNLPFLEESIMGYLDDFEEEFDDKYENIETSWSDRGGGVAEVVQYIQSRLQDGDPPEAMNTLWQTYLQFGAEEDNVFADHDRFDGIEAVKDRMLDGVIDQAYLRDGLYSIPWYMGAPATYSNLEFFEEAGIDPPTYEDRYTTDEYLDVSEALVDNSDATFGMAWLWSDMFASFFVSEGIDILNEDNTEAAFNTERTVEIMTRFQELSLDGVFPDITWTGEWNDQNEQFAGTNNVGMYIARDSALRPIQDFGDHWVDEDSLGIGPLSHGEQYGGAIELTPIGVVRAGDKSNVAQQAAFDLISVILNEKWQEDFLRNTTVMVPHETAMNNVREDEEFAEQNPLLVQLYEHFGIVADESHQMLSVEGAAEVWDQIKANFQEIGLGNVDPETGVANAEADVNMVLDS